MHCPNLLRVEKAAAVCLKKLPASTELWVAVSGGLDSVTLLVTTAKLFRGGLIPNIVRLGVLHVDHGLRGRESANDARFVQKLAKQQGIPCRVYKLAWEKGEVRNQEACRKKREAIFNAIREEGKGQSIYFALAHHRDDQAETVLLRVLRGTGISGLGGMAEISGRKIRPFLSISRAQIQSSAKDLKLTWREDSSNSKTRYERNWLRLEILPLLESRRPGVAARLGALAEDIRSLFGTGEQGVEPERLPRPQNFLKNLASLAQELDPGLELYPALDLIRLSAQTARLAQYFGLERKHVFQLVKLLGKGSGRAMLPGKTFWISCGYVLVLPHRLKPSFAGKAEQGKWQSILGAWDLGGRQLRAWQAGDGHSAKKKLLAARVPEFFRNAVPMEMPAQNLPPRILIPFLDSERERYSPTELARRLFQK